MSYYKIRFIPIIRTRRGPLSIMLRRQCVYERRTAPNIGFEPKEGHRWHCHYSVSYTHLTLPTKRIV